MERSCKTCKNKTWEYSKNNFPDICIECKFIEVNGEKQPSNWKPLPMTNADRIRAMSDEELAKWLCGISTAECCDRSCPARDMCDIGDNGMIKWLKQPAEVDHE